VFDYRSLAPLNAVLNGSATVLLLAGFVFIKMRRVRAHRACMIAAVVMSSLFLTSYLTFHYNVGDVRFGGHGLIRPIYFAILIPHVILAGVILPLAIVTLLYALRGRFPSHRRIARWTWPLWMYVSITGVVIYFLLYRVFTPIWPSTAPPVAVAASTAAAEFVQR
jgi:putative membrane protein